MRVVAGIEAVLVVFLAEPDGVVEPGIAAEAVAGVAVVAVACGTPQPMSQLPLGTSSTCPWARVRLLKLFWYEWCFTNVAVPAVVSSAYSTARLKTPPVREPMQRRPLSNRIRLPFESQRAECWAQNSL